MTYVEARESQQQDDWIRANTGAARSLVGVPGEVDDVGRRSMIRIFRPIYLSDA